MANRTYVAVDLGASSGRVLAAHFDGQRIQFDELHRFPNGAVGFAGHLYWDALRLWEEIQSGLRAAHAAYGDQIASIGIDTWGVDFALLDRNDQMLGNPFHYRILRRKAFVERACDIVPAAEIFAETGLQFNPLNTLFQLVAMREQNSPLLGMANSFLMIPDLFNWLLTGEKVNEFTDASTTQFLNPSHARLVARLAGTIRSANGHVATDCSSRDQLGANPACSSEIDRNGFGAGCVTGDA